METQLTVLLVSSHISDVCGCRWEPCSHIGVMCVWVGASHIGVMCVDVWGSQSYRGDVCVCVCVCVCESVCV